MAISLVAVSFDGSDVPRLAQFWADVLDRPLESGANDDFAAVTVRDGLRLMFHRVPEAKMVKNRVHLDVSTTDYETESNRLLILGAEQVNEIKQGGSRWRTFADPEGNEFDLIATAT